jgi:hypothetical protein
MAWGKGRRNTPARFVRFMELPLRCTQRAVI